MRTIGYYGFKMNGYRLNSEMVNGWLRAEGRKQRYLLGKLNVGQSLLGKMLREGHVPSDGLVLKALADLMGVEVGKLLLPREDKKTA